VLSRQDVPVLDATAERAGAGVEKGGYVLVDESDPGPAQLVLIGTGSEVQLCVGAAKELERTGVSVRVVSLPCWEWFEEQGEEYVAGILPPGIPTLSVEAGATFGWSRYADASVGLDRFGASAPGGVNMEKFGFTVDHVVERARALLATRS
jgi:transketolase